MLGGRLLRVAMLLALLLGGAGAACGSTGRTTPVSAPDSATTSCRAQWKSLGATIATQAAATAPSALPERWNNIAATIDYFSTSATKGDCGSRLTAQQQAITALEAFGTRLTPYDVPLRLSAVRTAAEQYAAGPAPTKPRKGAITPAAVKAALATLVAQAPVATEQQGPAWQQASVVDLGDAAATAKAVKDLQFLSTQSPAYLACDQALTTIVRALKTG